MTPPGPAPATTAGAANRGATGHGSLARSRVSGRRPPARRTGAAAPTSSPRPRAPSRAGPSTALGAAPALGRPRPRAGPGRLGPGGRVVVALLVLTASSTSTSSSSTTTAPISNAPTTKSRHRGRRTRTALKPASVTVAVLNGTSTTNLAHDISVKLSGSGYKLGRIATATDQTQTATVVGYLPGHRAAALIVAKSLGLGSASVQPVNSSNQAVACPQGAACTAQVVVTVGSDLSSAASTASTRVRTLRRPLRRLPPLRLSAPRRKYRRRAGHADEGPAQPARTGQQASPGGNHPCARPRALGGGRRWPGRGGR